MPKALTTAERKARLNTLIEKYNVRIDPQDRRALEGYTWCEHRNGNGYLKFVTKTTIGGKRKTITMYHLIMLRKRNYRWWSKNLEVMHLDGNIANLTRENLELGTRAENAKFMKSNKTGYPNVSYDAKQDRFLVYMYIDGKNRYVGQFANVEDAAIKAYEAAERHHNVKPPLKYYHLLTKRALRNLGGNIPTVNVIKLGNIYA